MSSIDADTRQVHVPRISAAEAARGERTGLPRVLHLINNFDIGGTERQAVELLKRIDRSRFDVRLAALCREGALYGEIAGSFPEINEFPITSFYNRNALKQLFKLRYFLVHEHIRILHAHDFYAGMIGSVAARLAGVKLIACQRHLRLSDRRIHQWGTNVINRLAHRVLVNSQPIRDYVIASDSGCAGKIVVIENGLTLPDEVDYKPTGSSPQFALHNRSKRRDLLCSALGLKPGTRLVGMLARLQPVKGHRLFLEAAALLARDNPFVHFVLIGGGPLQSRIEAQVASLGLSHRVHMLGERADGRQLIASVDLAVLSSLHEGLPNALMEAMAAGVPVVATAVGGVTQLVSHGETGYLVAPGNAQALATQMMLALRDEERTAAIALRGQQRVIEKFGMERMVEAVEMLYDEILTANSRARA